MNGLDAMILKPHSLNVGSLPRNGVRPNTDVFYMMGYLHGTLIGSTGAESGGPRPLCVQ